MMPSRGLRLAKGSAPRSIHAQCRNLSTRPHHALPRSTLLNSNASVKTSLRASNPYTRAIPATLPPIAAIRHASSWSSWIGWGKSDGTDTTNAASETQTQTQPQTPSSGATPQTPSQPPSAEPTTATSSPNAATAAPSTAEPAQSFNLDTITLDNIDISEPATAVANTNIPESIGYLKAIGVDYGWGLTSTIEWIFEHMHIWGGLPWWASIAATALLVRGAMFPLYLRQSDTAAREKALSVVLKPFRERLQQAQKTGDTDTMLLAFKQTNAIRKRAGISYRDQLLPLAMQSVVGYCGYKLMHRCATLPVPGFTDGGFLWLKDLTMTDGYLLMPIIMAGTMHLLVRLGGEGGATSQMPGQMKNLMLYVIPVFVAGVMSFQPGAVCLWFACTGGLGMAQGQILKQPAVRKYFGLAPLYEPTAEEAGTSFLDSYLKGRGLNRFMSKGSAQESTPAAEKNVNYMRPAYQSPTLNRRPTRGAIDTTLVTPEPADTSASASSADDEMIQPGAKPAQNHGVFESAKNQYEDMKKKTKPSQSADQLRKEERENFKRMSKQYADKKRGSGGR